MLAPPLTAASMIVADHTLAPPKCPLDQSAHLSSQAISTEPCKQFVSEAYDCLAGVHWEGQQGARLCNVSRSERGPWCVVLQRWCWPGHSGGRRHGYALCLLAPK